MTAVVEAVDWGWRHVGRRQWALRGLDLVIEQGEAVLLLGPSGAGKSTLLQGLAGMLHVPEAGDEQGRLFVNGQPARVSMGYGGLVSQDPSSALVMGRIGDEVAFGLENMAVPSNQIWDRVSRSLSTVGLGYPLRHPTDQLSGGEQQRLVIADVLAARPGLWLLDEPTANLDPLGADLVRATLRSVIKSDATVILVEHRVTPLVELVNRVVVLEKGGGVLVDGPPNTVFEKFGPTLRSRGVWTPGPHPARIAPVRLPGAKVIEGKGIAAKYQSSVGHVLDGVDIDVSSGQVLAITGSNGSGKTTLALILASLLVPTRGEVRFLAGGPDRPYSRWRARELVRNVGTVFQEPEHQFVTSKVKAELALGPKLAGRRKAEVAQRVDELMERLGLNALANVNPFTLSGGEKRRLSVATALAGSPALLVLDEPTFGQDASTWDELVTLLGEQRDGGCAVVVVTHDEALVHVLADKTLQMEAGRLTGASDRSKVLDTSLSVCPSFEAPISELDHKSR